MMLEAAIGYASRGWRVFPVAGKVPRLAAWPTQATTDEAKIRGWWRTWPTADIGIVTGDGLLVLDVDPRNGGDATLADLERAHGVLPETPRGITGGGGTHVFLRVDGPVTNRVGLAPGLDVRGDRGFVIVPPSLHKSGRYYEWEIGASLEDVPLAPAPPWLLELVARSGTGDRLRADGTPLVLREGERNVGLFRLACLLRRRGVNARATRPGFRQGLPSRRCRIRAALRPPPTLGQVAPPTFGQSVEP
jgi:Bifunctional DNA primase/polymerase, N-terminal